jgi:L-fucose isomerase-like protein
MKDQIKIGLAPTRRDVFSREDSLRYKRKIEEQLGAWDVCFENIDWLNGEGLLYDGRDARRVAERFLADGVDAIFTPHCNFGTEDSVALLAKAAGKPLLLWGPRDESPLPDGTRLRDTQCGLFATSKILRRLGVPFTYVVNSRVNSPEFERGFKAFLGAASAANAFRNARIGQINPRPAGFWTVMVNEGELLERWGIQVVPTSLVEISQRTLALVEQDGETLHALAASYKERTDLGQYDEASILKLAGLQMAIAEFIEREKLDGVAIQCWDALQDALNISSCFVDSELTGQYLPVACETDIHGALTEVMLQAAGRYTTPVFFADLTIRHPEEENIELLWHCGPFPIALARPNAPRRVGRHYILPSAAIGLAEWQIKGGDITIARFDGDHGNYSLLIGEAEGADGPFNRGTYLWVRMHNWPLWEQKLIYGPYIHHVAGIHGHLAPILHEACKYIPGLTPDPVEPTADAIAAYWRGQ